MQKPAVFFDRDNTLIVGHEYLSDPNGVILMPGAADAIARLRKLGYAIVVVSNQSGVARGMFSEDDVLAVDSRMSMMLLAENGDARIDRQSYCPYHPEATVDQYRVDSDLRKPKPGMILLAAREMDLDLSRSWLIGDAPRDIESGKTAGCRTILLRDPTLAASPASLEPVKSDPDAVVTSLGEATTFIETHGKNPEVGLEDPKAAGATESRGTESIAANGVQPSRTTSHSHTPQSIEEIADHILTEIRQVRHNEHEDFSISKLLAGIVQIIALACIFLAFLNRNDPALVTTLLSAIFFQLLTVSLLIMSRQR